MCVFVCLYTGDLHVKLLICVCVLTCIIIIHGQWMLNSFNTMSCMTCKSQELFVQSLFLPITVCTCVLLIKKHSSLTKSGAGHMYVINTWSILAVSYNFIFSNILLKPLTIAIADLVM